MTDAPQNIPDPFANEDTPRDGPTDAPPAETPVQSVKARISERSKQVLRDVVIDELRKSAHLSLSEFFASGDFEAGSAEWDLIMGVPINEMGAMQLLIARLQTAVSGGRTLTTITAEDADPSLHTALKLVCKLISRGVSTRVAEGVAKTPKAKTSAKPKGKGKSAPKGKKKAPPRPQASTPAKDVAKYVADADVGFEFQTKVFTEWSGLSQPRALRMLKESDLVEKRGEKRGMTWVVV